MWATMLPDGTIISGSMFGDRETVSISLGRITADDPECKRLMKALRDRIDQIDVTTKMENRPLEIEPRGGPFNMPEGTSWA